MTELYDFTKYPENDKTYGGNSGSKLGIDIDKEILFPTMEKIKEMNQKNEQPPTQG